LYLRGRIVRQITHILQDAKVTCAVVVTKRAAIESGRGLLHDGKVYCFVDLGSFSESLVGQMQGVGAQEWSALSSTHNAADGSLATRP
jgi:hypothetical protein